MREPDRGSGFTSLAVRFSEDSKAVTNLFLKPHQHQEDVVKALFVAGLPVLHHPLEQALQTLFSAFGPVASVIVHQSQVFPKPALSRT